MYVVGRKGKHEYDSKANYYNSVITHKHTRVGFAPGRANQGAAWGNASATLYVLRKPL